MAIQMRGGTAFAVVVCPLELRPVALERLRGKAPGLTLPDPIAIDEAWHMLDVLTEQVGRRDRVLSLTLGRDVTSALDGLNLHREKVFRGGPVILWLDDVDALMQMRERAPDAFSFRSTMVVVKGDGGPLPMVKGGGEEAEEVNRANKRLKRARTPLERANAGRWLAEELRTRNRPNDAAPVAQRALSDLGATDSQEASMVRSQLCMTLAAVADGAAMIVQATHWTVRALAEASNVPGAPGIAREAMIRSTFPGPFAGYDRMSVQTALGLVRSYGLAPEVASSALRAAGNVAADLGDIRTARASLSQCRTMARHLLPIDRAHLATDLANLEATEGDLISAENHSREVAINVVAVGGSPERALGVLTGCLFERGEIDAAVATAEAMRSKSFAAYRSRWMAFIQLERGDAATSLATLRGALRQGEDQHADGLLLALVADLAHVIDRGSDARRVSQPEIAAGLADLQRVETLTLALTSSDVPAWYPIHFLDHRAQLLALNSETLAQAIELARQSRDLARSNYTDFLPGTGRVLTDLLLRAALPDEALTVIAETEPEAISRGFLKERALLLANRILALIQRGDAPSTIGPHIAALREALAATDSPRITAETLRDLAKRLPPTATTPDPHALAEEALALFTAMPMPAQEARCLEIMGDVLLARGRPEEAKRRYLTSRARLQRFGLGLRLPLLDRKLAALP